MKLKLILLFTAFLLLKSYGQPVDKIDLPKEGTDIKINKTFQLYSLYITKNQEVYNDDKRLDYFQDISYSIIDQRNKSVDFSFPQKLFLYADKKVQYKFIDKIKGYFVAPKWAYYMTDGIEQLKATTFWLNYGNQNLEIEEIMTLEQDVRNEALNSEGPSLLMPPPMAWYHEFEDIIYSRNKESIDNILKERTHDVLQISKNKTINYKNKVIYEDSLLKLFKNNEVLFLKFDGDVLYEDYISAIQIIKDILKSIEKKQEKRAYVIEVSYALEIFLKRNNIKL